MIPLVTLFAAVEVAIRLLALLAKADLIGAFQGMEVYITVVAYASGVDYNLFLISRYQEELEELGAPEDGPGRSGVGEALARAIGKIGAALTASAATVVCGIGTLMVARFGKFREAGLGIAFCLVVMLLATMTLTPALLRLAGRRAFWPWHVQARPRDGSQPGASHWLERFWRRWGARSSGGPARSGY